MLIDKLDSDYYPMRCAYYEDLPKPDGKPRLSAAIEANWSKIVAAVQKRGAWREEA